MALQTSSSGNIVVTPGDGITASNQQNFLSVGDNTNLSGKIGGLDFAVDGGVNPVTGNIDQKRFAAGTTGVAAVSTEGTKTTYSVASGSISPAATASDIFTIYGSGTKTVRVHRIVVTATATSGATLDLYLIKRSAVNTSGTSTNPTAVAHDSNNAAYTATLTSYTANPTTGAAVGNARIEKLNFGAAGAAGRVDWTFTAANDQAGVLRGTSQGLAINLNGASIPSGASVTVWAEFVEDNS